MTFTQKDIGTLTLAFGKCVTLADFGLNKKDYLIAVIAKKDLPMLAQTSKIIMAFPFKFPEMTFEEQTELFEKLSESDKLAWLQEQKECP